MNTAFSYDKYSLAAVKEMVHTKDRLVSGNEMKISRIKVVIMIELNIYLICGEL